MRSRSLPKEDTSTVEEPASRGDGRHCSLCWTGIYGTQPQVDQLATPEGAAGHRALPHRRAGRASRSLHRLRTYDQDLLQLVPKQALPTMPGQRAPALAPGARTGTAAHSLRPRRLHSAAGTGPARIAEQAAHLQPALSLPALRPCLKSLAIHGISVPRSASSACSTAGISACSFIRMSTA